VIDLKPACQCLVEMLAGVTTDQLTNASPCPEYTVGDLVDHVDQTARLFAAVAHQDGVGEGGTDTGPVVVHLGPEWRERVGRHVHALGRAWDDPAAWAGSTNLAGLELSNQLWGKIALTEVVVHGWDIATATDQPFDLPESTLEACLDHVAIFVPNAPVPELWGPPVEVAPGASLLDRIVAITGRAP
jgi:uncharacterized protein (TIGR03086 family)